MRYLPQTDEDIRNMCSTLGVANPDALLDSIPQALQFRRPLNLPKALSEAALLRTLKDLGHQNETVDSMISFLGGGAYHHYIPVAVTALTSRGEFLTAYTPYQPEIAQGTLQAVFEFQTMVASLTGMELANASNYDGASALAEALLMAVRVTKRNKIILASSIHPQYRQVVRTYFANRDCEIVELPRSSDGRVDMAILTKILDSATAAVAVQSPNCFGVIEDLKKVFALAKSQGALAVASFSEALSLGFLQSPGALGADIVAGEGQSFGNFLSLGGPYLGLFATKKEFVRQMPGRLVAETVDTEGDRGYVLALSTREQHIRREKATSNICTNQGLCALTTAVYLSLLGPQGLSRLAQINYSNARYLREQLLQIKGVKLKFSAATFNEFVLEFPTTLPAMLAELRQKNIFGGIDVSAWGEDLQNCLLICATEMNHREQMDFYVESLKQILK